MREPKPPGRVTAEEVALYVRDLQGLAIPKRAQETARADLIRHNDLVRSVADKELDFFDVPSHFRRLLKAGGR
jgi:hypothetical protein